MTEIGTWAPRHKDQLRGMNEALKFLAIVPGFASNQAHRFAIVGMTFDQKLMHLVEPVMLVKQGAVYGSKPA